MAKEAFLSEFSSSEKTDVAWLWSYSEMQLLTQICLVSEPLAFQNLNSSLLWSRKKPPAFAYLMNVAPDGQMLSYSEVGGGRLGEALRGV